MIGASRWRGFARTVYADYRAHYYRRVESDGRALMLALPRMLINPSLHAVLLVRLCESGPRPMFFIWRNVLVAKHAMDIGQHCVIGPGLNLPHPFGVVLGDRVRLGRNVMLYHHVTLGTSRAPRVGDDERIYRVPSLGDDVVVHSGAVIAGGVVVGDGATIGANVFVDEDVPAGTVVRRSPER